MSTPRVLSYGRQFLDDDDVAAVVQVLRSDFLTQGPVVERFEAAVAARVGARHAVAVANGTAALHVACLAAEFGPGKVGVTSTLTFAASANAFLYAGGEAVLCDVEADGLNLSPTALRLALAARPDAHAVITVDFAGLECDASAIRNIAGDRVVIEDAAHALGGTYEDGAPIGSCAHADMTVFSFHPVKAITTGEGGMVTTNDDELARRLRLYCNHGIERTADRLENAPDGMSAPWYYEQQELGFNYRLSDIHAALGLSQLGKLDRFIARRQQIAARYDAAFANRPGIVPLQSRRFDRSRSALHLYVIGIDFARLATDRASFMRRLLHHGIRGQVHYIPVHRHPFYRRRYGYDPSTFPNAEAHYRSCLSLPLHAGLSDAEVERVTSTVCELVDKTCARAES